jgi:hypothetical protein
MKKKMAVSNSFPLRFELSEESIARLREVDFDFAVTISSEDLEDKVIQYFQELKDASDNDRPLPVADEIMKRRITKIIFPVIRENCQKIALPGEQSLTLILLEGKRAP